MLRLWPRCVDVMTDEGGHMAMQGHLDEARKACAAIPRHARPLMLSSVGVGEYLHALEAHDFDVFSPALQAVATRPTLKYQLQLKWHMYRGTY